MAKKTTPPPVKSASKKAPAAKPGVKVDVSAAPAKPVEPTPAPLTEKRKTGKITVAPTATQGEVAKSAEPKVIEVPPPPKSVVSPSAKSEKTETSATVAAVKPVANEKPSKPAASTSKPAASKASSAPKSSSAVESGKVTDSKPQQPIPTPAAAAVNAAKVAVSAEVPITSSTQVAAGEAADLSSAVESNEHALDAASPLASGVDSPSVIPAEVEFLAGQPPLPSAEDVDAAELSGLAEAVDAAFTAMLNAAPIHTPVPETEFAAPSEPPAAFEPVVELAPVPVQESGPSLFIVQITPELAPVAKVGGLADVVFGLSNELEIRGNHVEVILPKYDCLRYDHIWGLTETFRDLWVPWYGGAIHCTVFFGFVHGRKCFFIESHSGDNFFNRGCVYGFNDDVMRFAFFTRAAMEFIWKSGKNPDIIHCHDWQTALAPVFLYEIYQHLGMHHPRACFTIHNFKHQGVTGAQVLNATGLNRPEYYFHYDRLRDNANPHAINLMKGGVVYSNFVTTVSPRHAHEAKDQGQGFGLEPTLHIHHGKYGGVVNGIDYSLWNPEIDGLIPFQYSLDTLDEKYRNKRALRERLLLADNEKPIVAFVGRLDPQKGLELIRHAIFYTLHRGGQFVLLGSSPDGQINNYFWSLKHQLNENPDCHIEIGFNEELSHLIYAGADMVLVPSRFEPCGLTQMIALRYGTIPVVREIGGLADTVLDKDFSNRPLHERNGYVFRDYDELGLESALGRAISCYYEFPDHFRELMKNAIRTDYSWRNPGQDYLNIYHHIRDR